MFPSHLIHAIGGHMAELTHLNCFQTIPPWTRDHWSRWHREISCSPSFCTTWSIWWSAQPSCPRGERLKFHDFGWFRLISCISGVDMLMIDQWSAQSKWVPDRACNSYTVIYIYIYTICIIFYVVHQIWWVSPSRNGLIQAPFPVTFNDSVCCHRSSVLKMLLAELRKEQPTETLRVAEVGVGFLGQLWLVMVSYGWLWLVIPL